MRPFAALTAILLGSSAAITFGLTSSLIVFLFLQGRYPQFAAELPMLARYSALFWALTVIAGWAFYSLQRQLKWRWVAQISMWCLIFMIVWHVWPRSLSDLG